MRREESRILRQERLEDFLGGLLEDRLVFGPVMKRGRRLFDRVLTVRDLSLGRGKTVNSAKGILFPQRERLFGYSAGQAAPDVETPIQDDRGMVLFGVRPCDARGFLLLDAVFGGETKDPCYGEKRKRSIVISLACNTPDPGCFCTSLGASPFSLEGSDLLFIDLGDRYLVRAGGPTGVPLLGADVFEEVDDDAVEAAGIAEGKAKEGMQQARLGERSDHVASLQWRLESLFDNPVWGEISETCVGCGICTYLCPTCHCFDISDEAGPLKGERIRTWDSCQFPLFTRQASGVNPRPSAKERFRQRIMHKFCYLPKNGNPTGCVGCGRCAEHCPVNLDIREVVERLLEAAL